MSKRFQFILTAFLVLVSLVGCDEGHDNRARRYLVVLPSGGGSMVRDGEYHYRCAGYEYLENGNLELSDCCPREGFRGSCENELTIINPIGVKISVSD